MNFLSNLLLAAQREAARPRSAEAFNAALVTTQTALTECEITNVP